MTHLALHLSVCVSLPKQEQHTQSSPFSTCCPRTSSFLFTHLQIVILNRPSPSRFISVPGLAWLEEDSFVLLLSVNDKVYCQSV